MARVVHFDGFAFEEASGTLRRGTKKIPLTPRAADLLAVLLAQSGAVVSHDDLVRAVWDGVRVGRGSLKVRVAELRRALGDDAGAPRFIETVRQRGYRFVMPIAVAGHEMLGRPSITIAEPSITPKRGERLARTWQRRIHRALLAWGELPIRIEEGTPAARRNVVGFVARAAAVVADAGRSVSISVDVVDERTSTLVGAETWKVEAPLEEAVLERNVARLCHCVRLSTLGHVPPTGSRGRADADADPWAWVARGHAEIARGDPTANRRARSFFQRALTCEPDDARVLCDLAETHYWDLLFGWTPDPEADRVELRRLAKRAASLGASYGPAHSWLVLTDLLERNVEQARRRLDGACDLLRDEPSLGYLRAQLRLLSGDAEAAAHAIGRILAELPAAPSTAPILLTHASAVLFSGDAAAAVESAARAAARVDAWPHHAWLAICLAAAGREREARAAYQRARSTGIHPSARQIEARLRLETPLGRDPQAAAWLKRAADG